MANPILAGEARPLNSSVKPEPRKVPSAIKALVAELGLRYRPSAQADLDEHAASLALLACDLADVPPDLLRRAIGQHVVSSPYMPKASDLIARAKSFLATPDIRKRTLADIYNESMSPEGRAAGLRWVQEGSDLRLERVA